MEHALELRKNWLNAFTSIRVSAISHDTAARILAVSFVHGNNEELVFNEKYLQDIMHIQKAYHVTGGEAPDPELVELTKHYVTILEEYREQHKNDHSESGALFRSDAPEWSEEDLGHE